MCEESAEPRRKKEPQKKIKEMIERRNRDGEAGFFLKAHRKGGRSMKKVDYRPGVVYEKSGHTF